MCTQSHLPGSLASLCRNFNVDMDKQKMDKETRGFEWEEITKETWKQNLHLVLPYC